MSPPHPVASRGSRLASAVAGTRLKVASGVLVLVGLVAGWAGLASAAGTPVLQITEAASVEGVVTTAPVFPDMTVEYGVTVANTGTGPSGALSLDVAIPQDSIYVKGSATCGTIANCTVKSVTSPSNVPGTAELIISSVAAGDSGRAFLDVTPKQGSIFSSLTSIARWSGLNCAHSPCSSNRVTNHVLPKPVSIVSAPGNGATVLGGSTIVYTIQVNDLVSTPQPNVVVTDPIPAGTSYVAGSATCNKTPACTATEANGLVTYTIANLPTGSHYNVAYTVTVASATGTITNTAAWSGDICTVKPPCATASVKQAVAGAGLSITKSASPSITVAPNSDITYTFTLANASPNDAGRIVITDVPPPGTTYVLGSSSCNGLDECKSNFANGAVSFIFSAVTANGLATVTFQVKVNKDASGTIDNTGNYTGGQCASSTGCPTNTVSVAVGATDTGTTPTTTIPSSTGPGGAGGTGGSGGSSTAGGGGSTGPKTGPLAYTGPGPTLRALGWVGLLLSVLGASSFVADHLSGARRRRTAGS